jgi:hypothetical protein
MDGSAPYEEDVFAWSQHQAAALRRLAASGARLPNDLDLAHVAEEIEDLGLSELNRVLSHLEEMLIHLIKAASSPGAPSLRHWLGEIDGHQRHATRHFTPAMRQRVDLERIWRRARRAAARDLARFGEAMAAVPEACPYALDELLDEEAGAEALLAVLQPGDRPGS